MKKTEAKWLERVLEWKASGVGAAQFAQGKRLVGDTDGERCWQLQQPPAVCEAWRAVYP